MSLVLNESLVLAKTRSQDLKSVLKLNCWGSGIKDATLVRQMVNVEVIGLSCNEITTLEDFAYCPKLRELILRKNNIKNISEVAHLQALPKLTSLWLGENPCAENTHNYRKVVLKALPNLTVLDNIPVTNEELQEIEELGDEIYETPYESSNSSNSGPPSVAPSNQANTNCAPKSIQRPSNDHEITLNENSSPQEMNHSNMNGYNKEQSLNETSYFQPNDQSHDLSTSQFGGQQNQLNDSQFAMLNRSTHNPSRTSNIHQQQSRCLSLQGSVTTLNNSQHQGWSSYGHNNNLLPRGGKSRSGNILSAILCLVKELDYTGCEVVQTALHCRMEETSQ